MVEWVVTVTVVAEWADFEAVVAGVVKYYGPAKVVTVKIVKHYVYCQIVD